MSSHEEHAERPGLSETATGREGETAITDPGIPAVGDGPIPRWLVALIFVGLFWSGAYLFSYTGGLRHRRPVVLCYTGPPKATPRAASAPASNAQRHFPPHALAF